MQNQIWVKNIYFQVEYVQLHVFQILLKYIIKNILPKKIKVGERRKSFLWYEEYEEGVQSIGEYFIYIVFSPV